MKYKNQTIAIILARVESKRLKKKLLKKINSKTLFEIFLERLKKSKNINKILLSTSKKKENKILIKIAKNFGINTTRTEDDVVKRLINVLKKNKHGIIVRANADCTLMMPTVLDKNISDFKKTDYDLFSPFYKNKMPFGYSFVIFKRKTLFKIHNQAKDKIYREHVENFCFDNSKKFKIKMSNISKNSKFFANTFNSRYKNEFF